MRRYSLTMGGVKEASNPLQSSENYIQTPAITLMQHPVELVGKLGKFVDRLIHEQGDFLFLVWTFLSLAVIAWILGRKRPSKPGTPGHIIVVPASPPRPPVPQTQLSNHPNYPPESERPKGDDNDTNSFSV